MEDFLSDGPLNCREVNLDQGAPRKSEHQNVAVPIRNELGALLKRSGEPLPSVGFYDLRGALRGVHSV